MYRLSSQFRRLIQYLQARGILVASRSLLDVTSGSVTAELFASSYDIQIVEFGSSHLLKLNLAISAASSSAAGYPLHLFMSIYSYH